MNREEQKRMEELEQLMLPHFNRKDIPPPKEDEMNRTIMELRQIMPTTREQVSTQEKPINGLLTQAWLELKTSPKYIIATQLVFFILGIFAVTLTNLSMVEKYIFVGAPIILVIQLWITVRGRSGHMFELERTFRYGTEQLFFARFIMSSSVHVVVMILLLTIASIHFEVLTYKLLVVWLIPSMSLAAIFLLVTFKLPKQWFIGQSLMILWAATSFFLSTNDNYFYSWLAWPFALHGAILVGVALLFLITIKICKKEISHAFEYPITM